MGAKPDNWIRTMCTREEHKKLNLPWKPGDKEWKPMIEPFADQQVREVAVGIGLHTYPPPKKVISYGVSSYGYDCRLSDEFRIFTNVNNALIDPKDFDPNSFVEKKGVDHIIIPPNSFALGRTMEWFRIPRDILVIGIGKSTYARCGIILNVTPFEPEWEGYATLEISNTTPLPAKIYANEGICQLIFFQGDGPCDISYADKKGKYQSQQGIVTAKV